MEICLHHKHSDNILLVSWCSCCWQLPSTGFGAGSGIPLSFFLCFSFLKVCSFPAYLSAETTVVLAPQLNDNTFFPWEFWFEFKLTSWVLSPKPTWFHQTTFLLHFCLDFRIFTGIWGRSLGNTGKSFLWSAWVFSVHFYSCLFLFSSWQTF